MRAIPQVLAALADNAKHSQSVQQVASAEEASRLAFQNLPQHLIASLQGIVTNLSLEQQAQRVENEALHFEV